MRAGAEEPAAAGLSARSDPAADEGQTLKGRRLWRARTARSASRPETLLVHGAATAGRRPAYLRALDRLLGARPAGLGEVLLSRAPVLFLMIEEAFFLYVIVCLLRAFAGRRTAGFLLHPVPLVMSRRRHFRFKRAVLHWMKRFEMVQTMTVVPFHVLPAADFVAKGWIYDVELWDLSDAQREAVELLRQERRTGDRLVLTAIGRQSAAKGFGLFTDSYQRFAALRHRFRFIACGPVAPSLADQAALFRVAGGVAVDRVVSDAELLGVYAASDAVWCLYPPSGDHAIGVLGRAAQLGIPVIVREGSLAHRLCAVENIPHMAATAQGVAERLCSPLPPRDAMHGRRMAADFARQSELQLLKALGLAARRAPAEG